MRKSFELPTDFDSLAKFHESRSLFLERFYMSLKLILGAFLTVMVVSFSSGCGGSDEATVVEPEAAYIEQMEAAQAEEESGAAVRPM